MIGRSLSEEKEKGKDWIEPFKTDLKCSKKMVKCLVDTGADVSVITAITAERLGGKDAKAKRLFTGVNRSLLDVVGIMEIEIVSALGRQCLVQCIMMKGARNN